MYAAPLSKIKAPAPRLAAIPPKKPTHGKTMADFARLERAATKKRDANHGKAGGVPEFKSDGVGTLNRANVFSYRDVCQIFKENPDSTVAEVATILGRNANLEGIRAAIRWGYAQGYQVEVDSTRRAPRYTITGGPRDDTNT